MSKHEQGQRSKEHIREVGPPRKKSDSRSSQKLNEPSVSSSGSCAQADLVEAGKMLIRRIEEDCAVRGLNPENIDGYSEMKIAISKAKSEP